jgi:hypothetical protein
MLKRLWEIWKQVAHAIGDFQARVLLTVIYGVLVLPFGLLVRLFADPLQTKHRPTAWSEHVPGPNDVTWARKQ